MIIRNSATCTSCSRDIESVHRHDFITCECGNVAVDGGKDYIRRIVRDELNYIDTSIIQEDAPNEG